MEKGKPKGTEEIQHMPLVFPVYFNLHLAAWIKLSDLWINIVYLLSDYSVNKVTTCSTKVLCRLKRAKVLIGNMAKRALCEDTLFCHDALSEGTQSRYPLKVPGAAAWAVPWAANEACLGDRPYSAVLPRIAKPGSWYMLGLKCVPLPLFWPTFHLIWSVMQLEISKFSTNWPLLVYVDSVAEIKLYQNRSRTCVKLHC